jgi:hypothetical protein
MFHNLLLTVTLSQAEERYLHYAPILISPKNYY